MKTCFQGRGVSSANQERFPGGFRCSLLVVRWKETLELHLPHDATAGLPLPAVPRGGMLRVLDRSHESTASRSRWPRATSLRLSGSGR